MASEDRQLEGARHQPAANRYANWYAVHASDTGPARESDAAADL